SINVIAGVTEIRSSPPVKRTTPVRASSMRSFQPSFASVSAVAGKANARPPSVSASAGAVSAVLSVSLASGRFHDSPPGIATRVTSIEIVAPSVAPTAPRGSRYSAPRSSAATALRPLLPMAVSRARTTLPTGTAPSSSMRASTIPSSSTSTARVSPIPRSISHSGNRISRRFQQHAGLRERQSDHVRIATGDMADVDLAIALKRIAAGLAAPLAVTGVMIDLLIAQPFHGDHRLDQPLANADARHHQRDTGQDSVP